MFSMFISYSTHDLEWANYLKGLLTRPGMEVFVSESDVEPGESLSSTLTQNIQGSDLFVLIWSQSASDSVYVQKEVFYAKGQGKSILPVLIQPNVTLPPELGDIKYLDVTMNPESQMSLLENRVGKLAISKTVGDLVFLALLAFLGYALYKGGK